MRLALALTVCLTIPSGANADGPGNKAQQPPTDDAIISSCGAPLSKVFAHFGTPGDLRASGDNDGGVDLDYGGFGFKIKNKAATACFFWADWKGLVKGVKIGDGKDQFVKTLGANTHIFKHPDGLQDYGWDLKAPDAVLWVYFEKDDKVKKIDAELN
jgi:hypothetical protein